MKELGGHETHTDSRCRYRITRCVYQTTVDLIHAGYEVHIVTDCTSSRTEENRVLGIERMINEGAKPTSTEMALFELLKIAEDERFREISRLVK